MNEFEMIKEIFAPLSEGAPGAFGLTDDAALVTVPTGCELVVTKDALVAGVHFLPDDPPDLIARKALRVNLSDLAAKGAAPIGYVLALALPTECDRNWLETFASGFDADQREFNISLYGGDTVSTPGPLTLSITAFGSVVAGQMVHRSDAQPGDLLFVTGTIGDAGLGLKRQKEKSKQARSQEASFLIDRYLLPRPRTQLAPELFNLATAACDVSDGLTADAGHIAAASGVGIEIDAVRVPLSQAARAAQADLVELITCGDDYEVLFTANPSLAGAIARWSEQISLQITKVGRVVAGSGVRVLDSSGNMIQVPHAGYAHSVG